MIETNAVRRRAHAAAQIDNRVAEAQEAVDEARERLASVVESSRLGTWDWNMVTGTLVLNDRWAQMLGRELRELAPISIQTWTHLMHPDDLDASTALLDLHARGFTEFYELECRMRHRDGTWRWVLDRGRIVERDPDGTPLRMTGTHQDITDRKEAEQRLAASEARYRALVERMVDVVVAFDPQGNVTFASPSLQDLLGWDPGQLVGRHALDLLYDPTDRRAAIAAFRRMLAQDTCTDRLRLRNREGGYRWIESVSQTQRTDDEVTGIISVWRDVTASVEREEAAYAAAVQLSTIAAHVGDVVVRLEHGAVTWATPSITDALGGCVEDWLGVVLAEHVHADDFPALAATRSRVDAGQRDRTRVRMRDVRGAYHWMDIVSSPADGAVVLSMRVVDEDIAREGSLRRLAGSDSLTGLANRRELMNRLAWMVADQSSRTAVIFCDVDNLKQLNDTHGHPVGDAVLIAIATRMLASVRPDDLVARFGGDEFVILLGGVPDLRGALSAAERIRQAAQTPVVVPGGTVDPTLSMGVALVEPGETPGPLLQRADDAMYEAKRAGRNRTVVSAR